MMTPLPKTKHPWQFDKTISFSHLFTTLTAIFAALVFASKLDTRVSLLEQSIAEQKRDSIESKATSRQDLKEINSKLDRLIERGMKS